MRTGEQNMRVSRQLREEVDGIGNSYVSFEQRQSLITLRGCNNRMDRPGYNQLLAAAAFHSAAAADETEVTEAVPSRPSIVTSPFTVLGVP
jgi:hypothetical protein